jgi:hypothetical protein
MMKIKLLAAAASLLCASAAAQDTVSMNYDAKTSDATPARLPGACAITVTRIADQRNNKETVGSEFKPLYSRDPVPWVGAALGTLAAYGYTVSTADRPRPGQAAIDGALIRAYTFHGPMRINGVVALDATLTTPSGRQISRKYRASGSKTNMAGGTEEYMTTLNYAINNLVAQMAVDLQKVCAEK